MGGEKRTQAALATMLVVIFGGAALIALNARLLPAHHRLALVLFSALPIAAIWCAIQVLENDDK